MARTKRDLERHLAALVQRELERIASDPDEHPATVEDALLRLASPPPNHKSVLGHLAGMDEHALATLDAALRGQPLPCTCETTAAGRIAALYQAQPAALPEPPADHLVQEHQAEPEPAPRAKPPEPERTTHNVRRNIGGSDRLPDTTDRELMAGWNAMGNKKWWE